MANMTRIIIYPKDIAILTGKSEKYGRKTINVIKKKLNKEPHHLVTVAEYCDHAKIRIEEVTAILF